MPRYDFRCSKGTVIESVEKMDVVQIGCTCCAGVAVRVAVYAEQTIIGETCPKGNASRAGNITDSKGRTRVSLFTEACQEMNHAHVKAENEQGRKLESPNLYQAGLARARKMGAQIKTK